MIPILADREPLVYFNARRCNWILLEPWQCVFEDPITVIEMPMGFTSDLASIPRFLWHMMAPFELSIEAALIHDLLYRHRGVLPPERIAPYRTFNRPYVDRMFFDLMTAHGVASWRRNLAYPAVRSFGWIPWSRGRQWEEIS